MRGAGHYVDFYAAVCGADQSLDDYGVLVTLILEEDGVLRVVDELRYAVAAVAGAPDQVGVFVGLEFLAVPVGFEAFDDFATS